jgi:endo-1,4-beta-xylanase
MNATIYILITVQINDFNLEFTGPKVTAMQNLVKTLQSQRVPIDGIGFQGHLIVGQVPAKSTLMQTMEMFTSLGLEVAFTGIAAVIRVLISL